MLPEDSLQSEETGYSIMLGNTNFVGIPENGVSDANGEGFSRTTSIMNSLTNFHHPPLTNFRPSLQRTLHFTT